MNFIQLSRYAFFICKSSVIPDASTNCIYIISGQVFGRSAQPQPEPEPEPEPVVEDEPKKEPVNVTGIMAIILILALGGVGGFMYYTSTKNSKKPVGADPDQDYSDEDYLRSMSSDDEDEIQLDEEHEEIDESSDDGGNE